MPSVPKQFLRRQRRRLASVAALAAVWPLLISSAGVTAELVMFEEPGCAWCAAWNAEVGVVYDKTAEGREAPLRRVDMTAPRPDDLQAVEAVVYSPTFVLVQEGAEVGRITGYPGENFFWPMLQKLLTRLDGVPESCRAKQDKREGQEC